MNYGQLQKDLDVAVANGYVTTIHVTTGIVSYRHANYPINSSSRAEGRFFRSGTSAYYGASGLDVAQAEVPGFQSRLLCYFSEGPVQIFDLPRFADEYGYGDAFIRPKESGGWGICQSAGHYLTEFKGLSGIIYQSQKLASRGEFGINLVIRPLTDSWQGELFRMPPAPLTSINTPWN
jgi:hypothetical protein